MDSTPRRSVVVAVATFVAATLAYGVLSRAIDRAPRDEAAFWVRKVNWEADADVVLVGDSRVNRGVSPDAMRASLPGRQIVNFAFSGAGLCGSYLDAVDRALSPTADPPVVVIGVTPRALTPVAASNDEYHAWAKTRMVERWALSALSPILFFLTPDAPVLLFGRVAVGAPQYRQQAYESGWLPAERWPADPAASRPEYEELFSKTRVSETVFADLVAHASKWHRRGIRVFAFRPPTTEWMVALEDSHSGFSEAAVRDRLASAGVVWLDFDRDGYSTSDGNHMSPSGAVAFSEDLGQRLQQQLANGMNTQE